MSELRHAAVRPGDLDAIAPSGPDLSRLARRFDDELEKAGLVDCASVIESAVATLGTGDPFCAGWPLVLLDVPVASVLDAAFVRALAQRASAMFVTVPAGDDRAIELLDGMGAVRTPAADRPATALMRRAGAPVSTGRR